MILWEKIKLQTLDRYILRKFLGTYFVSIALIISIAIVFDFAENLHKLLNVSTKQILLDYYANFIPYFANLFSPLFNFIAVIYFTSKLASDSEIIAILSSGVSFGRFVRPYIIGAAIIALLSFGLGSYVIPQATKGMNEFKDKHLRSSYTKARLGENIHRQIEPNKYVYMKTYNSSNDVGYKFSLEHIVDGKLISKLSADYIKWNDEKQLWEANNYYIRELNGLEEKVSYGTKLDTVLTMTPNDYKVHNYQAEMSTNKEIDREIASLKLRGVVSTNFEIEKHKRTASPWASFVLTVIGVSLASRKVKGGLGLHLGLGVLISFSFIMFMQVTTVFATSQLMSPALSVWIPNILFGTLAAYLYSKARR